MPAGDLQTGRGGTTEPQRRVRLLQTRQEQARALDPEVVARMLGRHTRGDPLQVLTPRELEVLRLLAEGLESSEIAERLFIAVDTARKHIKNIYSKLGVHSRWEAIKHAEAYNLL